jgi:NAD(P)H dehydrogenase (quinone)
MYVGNIFRSLLRPFDSDSGTIFLTSTDVVGYRVATRLLKAGYPQVRVGIASDQADSQVARDLTQQDARLVTFSWEDESTYCAALQGVKTVFCVVPHHEGWADHFPVFFDTCRQNGVEHFVKISFYHALTSTRTFVMKGFNIAIRGDNPFCRVSLIKKHGNCDEKIMKSHAMDYTILFTTHLMSDPAVYQRRNILSDHPRFYSSSAGKGVNYVSPNDIASAAVHVLVNPKDHRRVGYTLTGPASITDDQVADLISKALNKRVEHVDLAPEDYRRMRCTSTSPTSITDNKMVDLNVDLVPKEFEAEVKQQGDPSWLVIDLVHLEKLKATGLEVGFLSKDFEKLCGRPAETFDEYLDAKSEMTPAELWI